MRKPQGQQLARCIWHNQSSSFPQVTEGMSLFECAAGAPTNLKYQPVSGLTSTSTCLPNQQTWARWRLPPCPSHLGTKKTKHFLPIIRKMSPHNSQGHLEIINQDQRERFSCNNPGNRVCLLQFGILRKECVSPQYKLFCFTYIFSV